MLSQTVFFEQPHTFAFTYPVHVTVTDEHGRSISDTGINNIPGASVSGDEVNKVTTFYLPPNLAYTIDISGYDTGEFTLIEQLPVSSEYTLINVFEDIPVTDRTEATLEIVPGEVDRAMNIDSDGDGTFEQVIHLSGIKEGEDGLPIWVWFTVVGMAVAFIASFVVWRRMARKQESKT